MASFASSQRCMGASRSRAASSAQALSSSPSPIMNPTTSVHARQWHPAPAHQVSAAPSQTLHSHPAASSAARRVACCSHSNGSSPSVGVVIVDHGSRKRASNEMLVEFVEMYKQVTGAQVVEVAHMEIAEPTIDQAIGKCVAQGASRVVVAPYFLSRGRHIQEDIPALVAEAKAKHSVECIIADPIGVDPLMAKLIQNRIDSALSKTQVKA